MVIVGLVLTACSDDGRELRPPGPDQTLSITTAPTTTSVVATFVPPPRPSAAPATTGVSGDENPLALTTPWSATGAIDTRYSCRGEGVAPALSWVGVPAGVVELAVVVTDPDAGGFVHWVLAGVDPTAGAVPEGVVPAGAVQAENSFGEAAWGGPCPPNGEEHTYETTLYALGRRSGVSPGQTAGPAIAAIQAAAVSSATVDGTFRG